ncbi:MAG: ribonuclease H family protein [Clostridium sp.]|nr:ribonuclease H family protein [Clostridium sp.]
MGKRKYYVVWNGVTPGVYTDWTACKLQINGVEGALYKSFATREEAEKAYASSPYIYIGQKAPAEKTAPASAAVPREDSMLCLPPEVPSEALAVDAACSGNPGAMEYRGVYLRTGETVFHFGPVYGTNNIGEFLAIVHALALMEQKGVKMPVYSDSRNALAWVKQKKCKTKLERTPRTAELYAMIERGENWLKAHRVAVPLCKWETERWGEIPADFGRK